MPNWTKEQQSVLASCNDTLLVSAAAGSGKTAVLVEKVYRLLQEGADIERMLIVTFTRAAAGEMRERIEKRLSTETDPHLRRQAAHINRAMISTLHAFCQKFLREQFAAAQIDPMFRLGSEHELLPLREKALSVVLEMAYAEPDDDEKALFGAFEDTQIEEMAAEMRTFLLSRADPFTWAREKAAQGLEPFLQQLHDRCRQQLGGAVQLIRRMDQLLSLPGAPERYQATLTADAELLQAVIAACEDGTLTDGNFQFARLAAKKKGQEDDPVIVDEYKRLRETWKECLKDARRLLPAHLPTAEETYQATLPALRGLIGIVEKTEKRYFAYKKRRNLLDFSDLEHLTLEVLKNEAVRIDAAKRFDYLFVDEYQDVSGIQEAIVNALHVPGGNKLFLVGDVKQSIYRFRLADPTLFLHKYETFLANEDAPCRKILLSANFRSAQNVLLSTNHVFSHAMRRKETEIEYDEDAMLRPGAQVDQGPETELAILQRNAADDPDGETDGEIPKGYLCEARYIARRIREMVGRDTIPEKDQPTRRPIRYRDIVILLRNASNRASDIAKVLEQEDIPVYADADGQYFDLSEVRDMMNLLRVIANPEEDLGLLCALRCPCFAFTEEDLSRIRLTLQGRGVPFHKAFHTAMAGTDALSDKCRRAWQQLCDWRFLSRVLPLDTFIWRLMEESMLYLKAGAHEDALLRRANLRLFAERAQGDNARLSVHQFLTAMDDARRSGDKTGAKTLGENEDVVRIMTMHKSKGLEFPVVFLMEMSRPFKADGDKAVLRMDEQLGCALCYIDGENRLTRDNPAMRAIREKSGMQHRAEEARLLYVGMTRARNRLIMTASPRNFDKAVSGAERSAYRAGNAKCMLSWVTDALGPEALLREGPYTAENGSRWLITYPQAEKFSRDEDLALTRIPPLDPTAPDTDTCRRMAREKVVLPPLKASVTQLAHQLLRQAGSEEESAADKRNELRFLPPDRPQFLQEKQSLTGAERGTVLHRALGLMPLEPCREGRVFAALHQLLNRGIFTAEEEQVLLSHRAEDALHQFFTSSLGQRMLLSPRVQREWSFTQRLENMDCAYIQGTIDLCFTENDAWVLCDYKTDALDEDSLKERYQTQLSMYKQALETITKMPVREVCLYSLHLGKAIPLE